MLTGPIGVGIVGTGRISDLHAIEYLASPLARIVALCDVNPARAAERAAAWGLDDVSIEGDIGALLARPDVDLVEILLPHHMHLEAALKARRRQDRLAPEADVRWRRRTGWSLPPTPRTARSRCSRTSCSTPRSSGQGN